MAMTMTVTNITPEFPTEEERRQKELEAARLLAEVFSRYGTD